MTPEQQVELAKALGDTIKGSKMFQMLICVFLLQGLRLAKKDNKCWQGLMTLLQSICIGGYLSSEMEGELASLLGIGSLAGGSIIGGLECAEGAGYPSGKIIEAIVPVKVTGPVASVAGFLVIPSYSAHLSKNSPVEV